MPKRESVQDIYKRDFEEAKTRSGSQGFIKLEDGANRLRLIQLNPDEPFYIKVGSHYNLGPEGKSMVYCPSMTLGIGDPCPICEFVEKVKKRSSKAEELELAKEISVRAQAYCWAIGAERKPLIFSYGPMIHVDLLNLVMNEYPDLADPEKGRDIIITKTGKGRETKYKVQPARESSSIDDDILDDCSDLKEYVEKRIFSYDELKRILDGEDPLEIVKERDKSDERLSSDERRRSRDDDASSSRATKDEEPEPRGRSSARTEQRSRTRDDDDDPPATSARTSRGATAKEDDDDDVGREIERLREKAGAARRGGRR